MPDLMIILIRTMAVFFVVFLVLRFIRHLFEGKPSVVINRSEVNREVKKEDPVIAPKYRFEKLPVPLIMDGKVLGDNLVKLEKNRFWLKSELEQKGIKDTKDVFLCTLDHRGKLYVSVKNR